MLGPALYQGLPLVLLPIPVKYCQSPEALQDWALAAKTSGSPLCWNNRAEVMQKEQLSSWSQHQLGELEVGRSQVHMRNT